MTETTSIHVCYARGGQVTPIKPRDIAKDVLSYSISNYFNGYGRLSQKKRAAINHNQEHNVGLKYNNE